MKKIFVGLLSTVLVLTSCAPTINNDEEVVKKEDETEKKTSIVPSYQLSDEMYRTILPYRPSAARGVITNQMGNRLDIDEMEQGLRRHSKEYFDPEKLFFEEGQYLGKDMMYSWLERKMTKGQLQDTIDNQVKVFKDNNPGASESQIESLKQELRHENSLALNPKIEHYADEWKNTKEQHENSPKYLSHILEQNFLQKKEDNTVELVGMSIGIAMKSVYAYQTEEGGATHQYEISKKEMLKKGKEIAQTVLKRIRKMEGLNDIPILIAIYREEDQGSPVPGSYVVKTGVQGGDTSIGEWEAINEENILFPSDEGEEKYYDHYQLVQDFGAEIEQYFPNYVGVIGKGFYINEELQKLTLEIPIEFYGKGEVIGFTQYTYGLVKEMFSDYYELEVKIKSNQKMESIIFREAGENEPTYHIFGQ
ncbi:CamS family sex pheromone protein [Virgibacillus doumboii]|uniref:CamS family sex pheromone protein n=1 Tax=Virgibacillus doumboii TaxID=2697503 RepID=UPI0013DF817B|nr:CamS family sex pheromone protein [Virgibacillus doumboii]